MWILLFLVHYIFQGRGSSMAEKVTENEIPNSIGITKFAIIILERWSL